MDRYLIVDPSRISRLRLRSFLDARRPGECVEVSTMTAGLRHAREEPWSLVVCDLLLPEGDGFALVEELRRSRPNLPVAVHSVNTAPAVLRRTAVLGCAGFLEKPLRPEDLDALLAWLPLPPQQLPVRAG